MIFPDGRASADYGKHEEQEPGDFQPEHVQDPAYAFQRDAASAINRPQPAILTGLATRYPQEGPALSTKIAGWQVINLGTAGLNAPPILPAEFRPNRPDQPGFKPQTRTRSPASNFNKLGLRRPAQVSSWTKDSETSWKN
jgi:hypothetical protein